MDSKLLAEYAERLDATGLHFARLDADPNYAGVRHIWTKIPWEQVILRFSAAGGGWTIVDTSGDSQKEVTSLKLEK